MVFVCPHCKKRKDNRKRSNQTCSDCFNEDQLHQQGKKTQEEERNEWQESVRKKEEEIIVVQKEQERKHEEIMKQQSEVTRLKRAVEKVEADLFRADNVFTLATRRILL